MALDPDFIQNAIVVAVGIVGAVIAAFKYINTHTDGEEKKKKETAVGPVNEVMAASFIDSRVLKELIDAIRLASEEYARDNKKLVRSRQDVISALEENTDAVLAATDASINLVRFMRRAEFKGGDDASV